MRVLQEGKGIGHWEGLSQGRDWRLKIESPNAFPGEFLGTESLGGGGSSLEYKWKETVMQSALLPTPSLQPLAIPSIQPV